VRFTHAFTTSTQAVPALSSVLTGELPSATGLRDNGTGFLSAKWETAAEIAVASGFKTLFLSGGSPVIGRTGLSQGFEIFDDYIQPTVDRVFRPLKDSAKMLGNWLSTTSKNHLFLQSFIVRKFNLLSSRIDPFTDFLVIQVFFPKWKRLTKGWPVSFMNCKAKIDGNQPLSFWLDYQE
jgi:hypothetical protein